VGHGHHHRFSTRAYAWLLTVTVASVVSVALTSDGGAHRASADTTPIQIGVATPNAPSPGPIEAYVQAAGAAPKIIEDYRDFSGPILYSGDLSGAASFGATLMVTWDPSIKGADVPYSAIISGRYDSYIRAQALTAAAWNGPIYIRFAHEMNLPGKPWSAGVDGNTPALFVAAWQHVVSIFRAAGATNVKWVWSPNADCGGSCPFAAYFPGDDWVDYVALDVYNFGAVHDIAWESFAQLFASSYAAITQLSTRPVIVAETASLEQGGDKATWITQAFLHDIPDLYPRVVAVVWWDQVDQTNWMVTSSPATLAAWQAVVASPLYGGDGGTVPPISVSPGQSAPGAPGGAPTAPLSSGSPPTLAGGGSTHKSRTLVRARIDSRARTARFSFGAAGARGYRCALVRRAALVRKPRYRACQSPKLYRNLRRGAYAFYVRASGVASPGLHEFTIR
jgi:hypothetical protein